MTPIRLLTALMLALLCATAAQARWGAMYFDPDGGADPAVGWAWELPSQQAARARAARECEHRAGQPCRYGTTFAGQCAVLVHGWRSSGRSHYSMFQTAYRGEAERRAHAMCSREGNSACRTVAWACSR